MYKQIIEIFETERQIAIEEEILKAVWKVGVYVDKEELLKALQYDRDQYNKGYEDGLNADKWIPCSERLPEEGEEVLCFTRFNDYSVGCLYRYDGWEINCEDYDEDYVLAWQPLPKPYKKEV